MATVSKAANRHTTVSTGWTNPTNAYATSGDNSYATLASAKNSTLSGDFGFPDFTSSDIPDGSTINSVTVNVEWGMTASVTGGELGLQPRLNNANSGSETTKTTTTEATGSATFGTVTLSDLRNAQTSDLIEARVRVTKGSTNTAMTGNLDYIYLTVDYTPPTPYAASQAAFRFYGDGTENGSTALENQDTNHTADVSSGDVNLQLRVRLQETGGGTGGASTDDYQLQYELNGSGTYADIPSLPLPDTAVDSYSESNQDSSVSMRSGAITSVTQSFTGDGRDITKAVFYLSKSGSPTGNITARLYNHSGVFGTSSVAGSTRVTSDPVDITTLTTSMQLIEFTFSTPSTMSNGTNYVIGLLFSGGSAGNQLNVAYDGSSPSHAGNYADSGFGSNSGRDLIFYVKAAAPPPPISNFNSGSLTDGNATTNRLGSGTGSFVAGKISEDGLVDDLQITASNYTELLYSLTIDSDSVADGDTLDFRVLRNGATTGMTYSVTPRITISSGPASQSITLPLLSSAETLYAPTITVGAVSIELPLLSNSQTLYSPSVVQNVSLPLIATGETLYAPTLTVGAVSVTLPLLTNSNTMYAPTFAPGAVDVTLPLLTNTSTLYEPALQQNVTLPLLSNSQTLYAPTLVVGAVSVTLPLISSAETLYAPTLTTGAVSIELPLHTNTSTLYEPTITQTLTVTLPLIASGETLYAPTLTTGAVSVTLPLLSNSNTLYAPSLSQVVALPAISSGEVLYAPSITVGAVSVTLPLITSAETLYAPTLDQGAAPAQDITLPALASTTALYEPTLTVGAVSVTLPLLSNSNTLYAPTLTVGSVSVTLPLLASTTTLHAPTITTGAVELSLPLIASLTQLFPPVLDDGGAPAAGTSANLLLLGVG